MIARAATLPDDFAPLDAFFRTCEAADSLDLDLHRHALQDAQTPDLFQVCFDAGLHVQGFARLRLSEGEDETEGRYWYYVSPSIIDQALGKREGAERAVGLISTLGTHPAHRGRGLGRALLLHTLRALHALGIDLCYISVDAANVTGAGRLYEAVGFQTFETWLGYFKYV